ncbi:hypothetical protein BDN72DRAFT_879900 [Pluteus cervinus]|uniref:Uncharacterized protein n=1 Tax=Pluteus cervinus TaxID=181527 RepID=A0ACD3AQ80_9AGAR|nr:hypothetical protein BDN72DRAFT_879900 [Pluteus cervinus]
MPRSTRSGKTFSPFTVTLSTGTRVDGLMSQAILAELERDERGEGDCEGAALEEHDALIPTPPPSLAIERDVLVLATPPALDTFVLTPLPLLAEGNKFVLTPSLPLLPPLPLRIEHDVFAFTPPPLLPPPPHLHVERYAFVSTPLLPLPAPPALAPAPAPPHTTSSTACKKAAYKAKRAIWRQSNAKEREEREDLDFTYRVRPATIQKLPKPETITTTLNSIDLPAAKACWVGRRLSDLRAALPSYGDLVFDGYKVVEWDGSVPHAILDDEERIVAVLVGQPKHASWREAILDAAKTCAEVREAGERDLLFNDDHTFHRRGNFTAISIGVSHGGGQTRPGNLFHPKKRKLLLQTLLERKSIQRIAGFQSTSFSLYAPKMSKYYIDNLKPLFNHPDFHLSANFKNSIFPSTTFNLGPHCVTHEHTDPGNVAFGLCAITALGSFNPKTSGLLALYDLNLLIQFPPGSTILIPSAIFRHGNTPLQDGESRMSITQYSAGGLFRYVKYGFKTANELGKKMKAKLDGDHDNRVAEALSLFSKFSELDSDRRVRFSASTNITNIYMVFSSTSCPSRFILMPDLSSKRKRKRDAAMFIDPQHLQPQLGSSLRIHSTTTYIARGPNKRLTEDEVPSPHLLPSSHDQHHILEDSDFLDTVQDPSAPMPHSKLLLYGTTFWMKVRDNFLDEFSRLDGRGGQTDVLCKGCQTGQALFRCRSCFSGDLLCSGCMVSRHRENPLHWVEGFKEWLGTRFRRTALKTLGLRIQVGHNLDAGTCPYPKAAFNDEFMILHVNGLHEVGLDFCGSTLQEPQTAASLALLNHAQILSFESKCSVYELYQTLSRLSDNSGIVPQRNRYRALLDILRQYRHLKMLKRAGRGHDKGGVNETEQGQCAVLCPACPQPGLNLPKDWKDAPADKRWLYALFLAMDANFRLRRRIKRGTSEATDPSLSQGWAYFVAPSEYTEHLHQFDKVIEQPKSTCSNHSAVNSERSTRGLAITGVGSVGCARHNFFRPHGIGDLQNGERYVNMDFIFFSSLCLTTFGLLIVSYDIACQWFKNLWARMNKYPDVLWISNDQQAATRFFVPKFHLPAHVGSCQTAFSFNLNHSVGRTDGEAPERGWSHLNPLSTSTAEMGPGSRRDTLEDHFGDWNWRKTKSIGTSLHKKLQLARKQMTESKNNYDILELGLPPDIVTRWKAEVELWEDDHQHPNPYVVAGKGLTQDSVRKTLNEQDTRDIESGVAFILHEDFTPSELITVGLELEHGQRKLLKQYADIQPNPTIEQKEQFKKNADILQEQMDGWIQAQELYMPTSRPLRRSLANDMPVQRLPLYLPSSILNRAACSESLREIEWQLRFAQAGDALNEARTHLRSRSYLHKFKDSFDRGQRANTRSQGLIDRVQQKYQTAYTAMKNLSRHLDHPGWEVKYQELKDGDVKGLNLEVRLGEGYQTSSWIWGAFGSGDELRNDENVHDFLPPAVRVDWCKSRARSIRWAEEVELLQEEIRRVKEFLDSQALVWSNRAQVEEARIAIDKPEVIEGRIAYAQKQAQLRKDLHGFFQYLWSLDHLDPDVGGDHEEGNESDGGDNVAG